MKYLASVIIPTYNREKLLYETLYSLTKQTLDKKVFEVIVCDDGSIDRTKEVVKLFKDDLNIKYFFQEDKGFRVAKARNMGIYNALGDICIFMDSGCIASNNFVEEHLKSHTKDRNVVIGDAIGFSQLDNSKKNIFKAYDRDNIEATIKAIKINNGNDIRSNLYKKIGEDLTEWKVPWVICWTLNLSIKTEFLKDCGGFDEWFDSWGGEDTDLGINLYVNKGIYKLNRNAIVIHLPHKKTNNFKENPYLAYKEQVKKRRYIHNKYKLLETLAYVYIDTENLNDFIEEYKKFIKETGDTCE